MGCNGKLSRSKKCTCHCKYGWSGTKCEQQQTTALRRRRTNQRIKAAHYRKGTPEYRAFQRENEQLQLDQDIYQNAEDGKKAKKDADDFDKKLKEAEKNNVPKKELDELKKQKADADTALRKLQDKGDKYKKFKADHDRKFGWGNLGAFDMIKKLRGHLGIQMELNVHKI